MYQRKPGGLPNEVHGQDHAFSQAILQKFTTDACGFVLPVPCLKLESTRFCLSSDCLL